MHPRSNLFIIIPAAIHTTRFVFKCFRLNICRLYGPAHPMAPRLSLFFSISSSQKVLLRAQALDVTELIGRVLKEVKRRKTLGSYSSCKNGCKSRVSSNFPALFTDHDIDNQCILPDDARSRISALRRARRLLHDFGRVECRRNREGTTRRIIPSSMVYEHRHQQRHIAFTNKY